MLRAVQQRRAQRTFLAAHWETVAATDFFTVEVATVRRLVTYYVLVVIELSSRKVHIAGITPGPDGPFMMQVGRNLESLCQQIVESVRLSSVNPFHVRRARGHAPEVDDGFTYRELGFRLHFDIHSLSLKQRRFQ